MNVILSIIVVFFIIHLKINFWERPAVCSLAKNMSPQTAIVKLIFNFSTRLDQVIRSKRRSFSKTKSKNYFSRIFVNCNVTHNNWAVTSYVTLRVLVKVYMHDLTSDVWRHEIKIFKVKVQHSEKSGFVTECYFWKQNPDQIRNFQKIFQKIGM